MNLDDLWTRISEFVKPHLVFPATPESDGGYPTAVWPDDDPAGFFEFATKAGLQVFYIRQIAVDDEVAARLLEDFTDGEIPHEDADTGEDDELTRDLTEFHTTVAAHRNETISVEIGFFVGSVYHVYAQTAEWANDLSALGEQRRAEDSAHSWEARTARREEVNQARDDAAPKQQEWVELLCEDKGFIGAINDAGRHAAAAEAIPEMAPHLDSPRHIDDDAQDRALRWAAWGAVREATETVRSKVRPQRETQALSDLDAIITDLHTTSLWRDATTKQQQTGITREYLEDRLGFKPAASLTERVVEAARRKPSASSAQLGIGH
jgi:hypothetical protein